MLLVGKDGTHLRCTLLLPVASKMPRYEIASQSLQDDYEIIKNKIEAASPCSPNSFV